MLKLLLMEPKKVLWGACIISVLSVISGTILVALGFYFTGGLLLGSVIGERLALTYFLSKQLDRVPKPEEMQNLIVGLTNILSDSGIDLTALTGGKK